MEPGRQAAQGRPRQALIDWVRDRVGPVDELVDHSHDHRVTEVWSARAQGARVWLKVHTVARKYRQEQWAYAQLVPWLRGRGHRVPELLGCDEGLRALLLSDLAGVPSEGLSASDRPGLFRQAGALLADIHRAPFEAADPMPLEQALGKRAERWCAAAEGLVDAPTVVRVRALLTEPGAFEGVRRVVCHRDFSPRNWLVAEGRIGLIDFEHCRHDLWLTDLQRLEEWEFHRWPEARAAFFEGYGRGLCERERAQLLRLRWFYALGTVAWAREHGDASFESQGRAALERLKSEGWGDGSGGGAS